MTRSELHGKTFQDISRLKFLPATICGQGNIFTPVCHSFCSQGGSLPQCMLGYPPEQTPPGADTHDTPPPGQQTPPGADIPPRGRHTPRADTPQEQTPLHGSRHPLQSRHPPEQKPPRGRHPPGADTPLGADPPKPPTPPGADTSIRSTSGRYASYWNAFLLFYSLLFFQGQISKKITNISM